MAHLDLRRPTPIQPSYRSMSNLSITAMPAPPIGRKPERVMVALPHSAWRDVRAFHSFRQ
ncbi:MULTISPECIES: hypothetical protein [Sphingomonas]|uniref:hypothetical protein n=1 Tax=Sphingomonas TaxID=13687 RepID=UPI002238418F|nr:MULTISPECIES: hypothetical protein [Sphingomonas]MCW6529571.1 hypothetical protein [Sphingomonas lycopersici]